MWPARFKTTQIERCKPMDPQEYRARVDRLFEETAHERIRAECISNLPNLASPTSGRARSAIYACSCQLGCAGLLSFLILIACPPACRA